jgi:hypothetical protein
MPYSNNFAKNIPQFGGISASFHLRNYSHGLQLKFIVMDHTEKNSAKLISLYIGQFWTMTKLKFVFFLS